MCFPPQFLGTSSFRQRGKGQKQSSIVGRFSRRRKSPKTGAWHSGFRVSSFSGYIYLISLRPRNPAIPRIYVPMSTSEEGSGIGDAERT